MIFSSVCCMEQRNKIVGCFSINDLRGGVEEKYKCWRYLYGNTSSGRLNSPDMVGKKLQ